MQLTRAYQGTVELGNSSRRRVLWGVESGSYTDLVYENKVNFINETIASFLVECGITDAAYTQISANGDAEKWLYIYGTPFLIYQTYNAASTYLSFGKINHTISTLPFSGYSSGDYNFNLFFSGSRKAGFLLRISAYNNSSPSTSGVLILPCANIATGKPAVASIVYSAGTSYSHAVRVIDVVSGSPDMSHYDSTAISYACGVNSLAAMRNGSGGKFPLIPIFFGIYKADKLYQHLSNFGIPAHASVSAANQTEFSVGGHIFLNFGKDGVYTGGYTSSNGFCSGILDVTE